jgi:hypothetical protein
MTGVLGEEIEEADEFLFARRLCRARAHVRARTPIARFAIRPKAAIWAPRISGRATNWKSSHAKPGSSRAPHCGEATRAGALIALWKAAPCSSTCAITAASPASFARRCRVPCPPFHGGGPQESPPDRRNPQGPPRMDRPQSLIPRSSPRGLVHLPSKSLLDPTAIRSSLHRR